MPKYTPYQPIINILKQSRTPTASVCHAVSTLQTVGPIALNCLPEEVRAHCTVSNWQGGILTFHTRSAAWATRVRYLAPTLLQQLRQHPALANVRDVKCRVSLSPARAKRSAVSAYDKPTKVSVEACSALQAAAEHVQDEALSAALRRLATHIHDPSSEKS